MIPRRLHFIWIGSPLPAWASRNIDEFKRLNPEFEVVLHDKEYCPDAYKSQWRDDLHPSTKSDLMRYDILRREGGWYFDVDYWPCRPIVGAERAYGLDGSKLFAARMNNPRINNGVLACAPGCKALDVLDGMILAGGQHGTYGGRTQFGPPLLTRIAEEHKDLMCVSSWPWFHGIRDIHAAKVWRRCALRGDDSVLQTLIPETGGQKPFAFHMWAHTHGDRIENMMDPRPLIAVVGKPEGHESSDRPWPYIAQACEALGFRAEMVPWDEEDALDGCSDVPEAVFLWNGIKGGHKRIADKARMMGSKIIVLEYGFYDRGKYFQMDHAGLLHNASWADKVCLPAPKEGAARLEAFYPSIRPMRVKRDGYVLVLGQVPNDSQLAQSEITGPLPLQRAVKNALPNGVACWFRPHPSCSHVLPDNRALIPTMPTQTNEFGAYEKQKQGQGLLDALAGARIVVTINSNAMVEALAAGVPCLAFGPSLGITAGAVHPTRLDTIRADMKEMLAGWMPAQDDVTNYLRWLAARQYSCEEFAEPKRISAVLQAAGVSVNPPVEVSA